MSSASKSLSRYGGTDANAPVIRERLVDLKAWPSVPRPGGGGDTFHVLGTGSSSARTGPNGFAPNTVAFNPDTWTHAP